MQSDRFLQLCEQVVSCGTRYRACLVFVQRTLCKTFALKAVSHLINRVSDISRFLALSSSDPYILNYKSEENPFSKRLQGAAHGPFERRGPRVLAAHHGSSDGKRTLSRVINKINTVTLFAMQYRSRANWYRFPTRKGCFETFNIHHT